MIFLIAAEETAGVMMDNAQKELVKLLKGSLFGMNVEPDENVDWEAVIQEARAQTVTALAAGAIEKEHSEDWNQDVLRNIYGFMRVLQAQSDLIELFKTREIPLVILKGTAAAMYYPVPERRAMGDIDFLVPQDRFDPALQLMEDHGYRFIHQGPRHTELMKDGIEFELHRQFSRIDDSLTEGFDRREIAEIKGHAFPVLPKKENGLILLSHAAMHLQQGKLGLRQVIDWMMYVHCCLDDAAWYNGFQQLAAKYGLEKLAVTLTWLCREWLGLPGKITWCEEADPLLAEQLLDEVFKRGNFGRKLDKDRRLETVVVSIRRLGFFHYLQHGGLYNWQASRKYPVLRPFAWAYQLCRWGKKGAGMIFRPRKMKDEMDTGRDLYSLNKQLGLYDSQ